IARFGGDLANVTIFRESTGAVAVCTLMPYRKRKTMILVDEVKRVEDPFGKKRTAREGIFGGQEETMRDFRRDLCRLQLTSGVFPFIFPPPPPPKRGEGKR
ncbi:MAG: carboxylesterase family protein, partial [Deltaproteobacteria bacterium]|nr:carboxylesterase family protein [Deltaproteobacteria bacterium]